MSGPAAAPDRRRVSPAVVLFAVLFSSQAGVLVLAPLLVEVARDFSISTSAAGQLRTVTGVVAGATALLFVLVGRRLPLRPIMLVGLAALAAGSLVSAAAPSFLVLAGGQVGIAVSAAILAGAGLAAAGEWAAPEHRSRLLSVALLGPPAAWIVGMPAIGAVGEVSWRYAWLLLPLVASIATAVLVVAGPPSPPLRRQSAGLRAALRERTVARWALAELLATSAWSGTLVYAGALFVESHEASATLAALILAAGAGSFLAGNLAVRVVVDTHALSLLVGLGLAAAVAMAAFGGVRPDAWTSGALFAVLAALAGARVLASSAVAAHAPAERRLAMAGLRGAAVQFGYLFGAAVGGAALATGGYTALGVTFAALFAAGVAPYVPALLSCAGRPARWAGTRAGRPCASSAGALASG